MTLTLPRELEELVDRKVVEEGYDSRLAVIREALQLLDRRDAERRAKLELLRQEIGRGLELLDRGETRPFDAAAVDRIIAQGELRLAEERARNGAG